MTYVVWQHSNSLHLADDIKIYCEIKSLCDTYLLQSDINSVSTWFITNFINFNANKPRVISLWEGRRKLACF